MQTSFDILSELKQLSPLLADMERVNVFSVPDGYFDTISDTVMACMREENNYTGNENNLPVPEGYFDNLAGSILDRIKAQETALDEIKALSPLLHSIQHKNVFTIPEGYFDELNSKVMEKVSIPGAVLDELPVLLSSIRSVNPFEVPTGYFDNFPNAVLQKINPPQAKVISIRSRVVKYAAAAVMTGVILLGGYLYTHKPVTTGNGSVMVATLDPAIEKGTQMSDKQFEAALNNLSEGAITAYLEKHGDVTDVATLGNNVDESTLPSEEDYILDDKTLEKYLNQVESATLNN